MKVVQAEFSSTLCRIRRLDFERNKRSFYRRWLGHIERMQDTAIPKKMYGKLYATRRRGRPKMRWLDDVSMDLRKMGVNEWRDRTRNREAWRHIIEEAKAHPGL